MAMRVRVPATTANVGSGFDCVGIALDWYDALELEVTSSGLRFEITGEGAQQVPRDESHLVIASLRKGLDEWGGSMPEGLTLRAHNTIPHSRGLGSSAAAIVAGLAFAWGLARGTELDRTELARLASLLEGHADNAAAAVWGGGTLGWIDGTTVHVTPVRLHRDLTARVWIPEFEVPTKGARSVLPETVSRHDAVSQAAASAHLLLALSSDPAMLLRATEDKLHQSYRAELMESSYRLMQALRANGVPATISGAGPSVFAIGNGEQLAAAEDVLDDGFHTRMLSIGEGVTLEGFETVRDVE